MTAPHGPSDFEALIPSVNGSFCKRFVDSLSLPKITYEQVASIWNEDGTFTEDFVASLCACAVGADGGDGGTGTTLQPPAGVMATDGDHSDKVRVTWSGASGATSYLVYRNTVNSSVTAQFLQEVTSTAFDDVTAEIGTTYFYWVKSKNATETSAFSASDSGFRAEVLDAITDLSASQGFHIGLSNESMRVRLVFTPPTGAEQFDFYRNTVDNFATAQLIDSNRAPFDNSATLNTCPVLPCTQNTFINNDGELVYWHPIPDSIGTKFATYYYWVRARKVTMPAISPPSNSAQGWAVGFGDGIPPLSAEQINSGSETTVASGLTEAWLVLFGGGAGGAGGSTTAGGGGAGGPATIWGKMTVVPGSKFRVRSVPTSGLIGGAPSNDGDDGYETLLEYTADGNPSNYVAVMTCSPAEGGKFAGGGGGAGGIGGVGSASGSIINAVVKNGIAGKAGSGATGGRSGYRFGSYRLPPVRLFPENNPRAVVADFSCTGSGSDADVSGLNRGAGVDPLTGRAVLAWRIGV